jgi:hypothetical protein
VSPSQGKQGIPRTLRERDRDLLFRARHLQLQRRTEVRQATGFVIGMSRRYRSVLALGAALLAPLTLRAQAPALPSYDLDVHLDVAVHEARVHMRVSWTNPCPRPAEELVFNVHPHFKLPDADIGMTAKMFEILRVMPGENLDLEGRAGHVRSVNLVKLQQGKRARQTGVRPTSEDDEPLPQSLSFSYRKELDTALVVPLPQALAQGDRVVLDLDYVLRLPARQGRWGQWQGVTSMANWLPVLAYYDAGGWQPTPYIPWHPTTFNEAGIYSARLTLPADHKVACTAPLDLALDLGHGQQRLDFAPCLARDFSLVCSARFREFSGQAGSVTVRCLAFPEHEHYARHMVRSASDSLNACASLYGTYPYAQYTIVEASFGWHANECAGLLMIDDRIFSMSPLATGFVDYLITQGTCQQWWYNVVGSNGYRESCLSKGLANYLSHRLLAQKYGKDSTFMRYPRGLQWLPNVRREDYRHFNLSGTIARGETGPIVQDLPKYQHLVNVYSMCYERAGKVFGMIESRLGTPLFDALLRRLYVRFAFRMLRVADLQRELEACTGDSWQQYFQEWVYGAGFTDWCIDSVHVEPEQRDSAGPCRVSVLLRQKGEYNEPTVLGFDLGGNAGYQLRIPVFPHAERVDFNIDAHSESLPGKRVRIEVRLPRRPVQIVVDPDEVLLDRDPGNNCWKARASFRLTPLYTFLDETDLTNAYDRWNFIAGPWLFAPTYDNPFFTRATRFGVRAGAYRTSQFEGGVYTAYRTDYRDIVTGVDMILGHWPWNHTEIGFVAERRLAMTLRGQQDANRGVLYGRYVIDDGDSLYLPPFQYVEGFGTIQDDLLPYARQALPGAERFQHQSMAGLHYHLYYLTPYWDPEGGVALDLSYAAGFEAPGEGEAIDGLHQVMGQCTYVQALPDGLGWWSESKFAVRAYGALGLPSNIQFFALGGGELFRGFDLAQRQGSALWVGSLEWRFPLVQHLNWGVCKRALEVRNVNAALFSDVGNVYQNYHSVGGLAESVGAGLRVDVSWFTFVERTILRFDAAKTVNAATPWQYWIGIEHPF